jgi:hypothetical protein
MKKRQSSSGVLPIIDGPWKGDHMAYSTGTFEAEGREIGDPLTAAKPGAVRVRYYRQQSSIGWVWSTQPPGNADDLMREEETEIRRLVG